MAICNGSSDCTEGPVQNLKVKQQQPQQHQIQHQNQKQSKQQQQFLPAAEIAVYIAGFSVSLGAAGYAFYTQISHESLLDLDSAIIQDGFLGYKKDDTFMDLNHFLTSYFPMLLVLSGQVVVSQLSRRFCSLTLHHLICALFTMGVSCALLSLKCTALLLTLHCCTLLAASTGSALAVWSVVLLIFLRFTGSALGGTRELKAMLHLDARGAHLMYPIGGYFYCRLLSMGLSLCGKARSTQGGFIVGALTNLPASLHYAFYLPNFLGGPMVTMESFLTQRLQQPQQHAMLTGQLLFRASRLLLWLGVAIATVHFLPIGAYLETIGLRLVRHEGPVSFAHVAFAMYIRGQLFMLEYVQFYGWPALFAALDGIQLPHWPACICRVTSYREMWRLFDRGLFAIVKQHVYIPLGGSRNGLARQLVATAASFGFICIYHGNYESVQLWILLNLALVTLELLAIRLYRSGLEAQLLRWFSHRWLRRLTGVAATANMIPPSLGIFYFLYGTYAGNLLMREIVWKPVTGQASIASFAIFFLTFYCSVQLAIEYKLRRPDADKD